MELSWLETFIAVVDQGGFTAASEHVHRSQSRVSAHIAALERELGTRLIDRTRRPAVLTTAGDVLVRHAREIVAGVGSARSAVGALRAMDSESLVVITTPSIGTAWFPGLLAGLLGEHPGVRLTLFEDRSRDVEQGFAAEGAVLGVLPTLDHPLPAGMQERLLWREPLRVVVPPHHELAQRGAPVSPAELARHPLVVCGAQRDATPEVLGLLAARGHTVIPRATADTPQSIVALAAAGVGVGVLSAVAIEYSDTTGVVVLDIDDADMVREVAAYWYDVPASWSEEQVNTQVGKALHQAVLAAPVPAGATPAGKGEPG